MYRSRAGRDNLPAWHAFCTLFLQSVKKGDQVSIAFHDTKYGDFGGYGSNWFSPSNAGTFGANMGHSADVFGAGYTFNSYLGSYTPGNFGSGYQMGQNLSDQDIEQALNETLDANPATANATIKVQSQDHVVTLTGTVRGKHVKIIAGDMAWMTSGVRDVNNTIEVKSRNQQPPGAQTPGQQAQEQQEGTQATARRTTRQRPTAAASGASK